MTRYKRFWCGSAALALGVGCLTSCQSSGPSPRASTLLVGGEDRPVRLSDKQAADVQVALGRTQERRGEPDKALATYLEALRRDPQRADALLRAAILLDHQGKSAESLDYYRKALKASPGNPDIYADMGYSLYLQQRWAEAEMNLRQAVALAPGLRRAHNNLGLVLARTDRAQEALAAFHQGGCEEADARANVAFALTLQHQWAEAKAQYELALQANPHSEAARRGSLELERLVARAGTGASPAGDPGVTPVRYEVNRDE